MLSQENETNVWSWKREGKAALAAWGRMALVDSFSSLSGSDRRKKPHYARNAGSLQCSRQIHCRAKVATHA
jgi:hypothetical protein